MATPIRRRDLTTSPPLQREAGLEPEFVSLEEARIFLGRCGGNTVRRLIKSKRLRAKKLGSKLLIDLGSLRELTASLPSAQIRNA